MRRLARIPAALTRPDKRMLRVAVLSVAVSLLAGCARPGAFNEGFGDLTCTVDTPSLVPLVVEWPSAERAALESRVHGGVVVVRYESCDFEILPACRAEGGYRHRALTPKRERVTIRDEEELYARLPMGAHKLERVLEDNDMLEVDMTIVGHQRLDRGPVSRAELRGQCEGATHVVNGLAVGAFSLAAKQTASASVGLGAGPVAAGRRRDREVRVLATDGVRSRCSGVSPLGTAPEGCGALLQIEASALTDDTPLYGSTEHEPAAEGPLQLALTLEIAYKTRAQVLFPLQWGEESRLDFAQDGYQFAAWVRVDPGEVNVLHLNLQRDGRVLIAESFEAPLTERYRRDLPDRQRVYFSVRPTRPPEPKPER